MNSDQFLKWMEENNLLEKAKEHIPLFKKILTNCVGLQEEYLLIIADTGYAEKRIAPIIAGSYYLAAKELKKSCGIIVQEPKIKGDKAEPEVIEALTRLNRVNAIIMCLSGRLGSIKEIGKSFRSYTYENYHKFISTTSLGKLSSAQLPDVISTIDIDYSALQKKGQKIKEKLDLGNEVRITTKAGTDLVIGIQGMKAILNTGQYTKPRTGGNIPAGEVYIPPKWKNANGKLIIDGSSRHRTGTQLIETPIELTIKNGEVTDIKGEEEADKLIETLEWAHNKAKHPWGIRRIGELGIGINPNAKIIGATIVDEKMLGTAHIAIGSNYWFGGTIYAIIHLDQVFKNPKIYIDGELLEV